MSTGMDTGIIIFLLAIAKRKNPWYNIVYKDKSEN